MDKQQAQTIIKETFEKSFEKEKFTNFIIQLLNLKRDQIENKHPYSGNYIPDSYKQHISTLARIAKYKDVENKIDVLIIKLRKEKSIERARAMQRNFIAWYLNGSRGGELKDAALVAFVSPNEEDWRFSLVKMDYRFEQAKNGKVKIKEEFTPARRWSFLVGKNESSHTAQSRLVRILADDEHNPTFTQMEEAFNIEKVTREFFEKYRELFLWTKETLDKIVERDTKIKADFEAKGVNTIDFAKKLLGQIVFLYFLQKKGWFGVERDAEWGTGTKKFLRELFDKEHGDYDNFFNDVLEHLFYDALRDDRSYNDYYYGRFNCKIPFLNGGLFDPINGYDWVHTDIFLPNELFSNQNKTKEGDTGNGILDIFDRYNFTVKEDEPLEKEVAVDPEMLGKVFENLLEVKDRKSKGSYYTPREIVHYMCQQSLINYLNAELDKGVTLYQNIGDIQTNAFGNEAKVGQLDLTVKHKSGPEITKDDIEILIKYGEQFSENEVIVEAKGGKTDTYSYKLPENIRKNAKLIDEKLASIKVCDPAIGSGAFPVGMMHEIVKTRNVLSAYINDPNRTVYHFKRECIEKSLYGVDIDPGAVEIAKLRLWLSLVVDEEDIKQIKPLPNLDYKIVCGNSLLGVEKNLFNRQLFGELERLKPLLFNETNPTQKQNYKQRIDELISQITNGHKEFDFEVYFSEVFHEKKGFDVVIANPPYVGEKGHKEVFREIKRRTLRKFYLRKMDLFYFFFHLALDIGKTNSQIAFITTNYYLTADGARKLRQDLKERAIIKELINFNELRIFESALGQHNMLTLLTKTYDINNNARTCMTRRVGVATPEILLSIVGLKDADTYYYSFPASELYEENEFYIRIEGTGKKSNNPKQQVLNKIKSQGEVLGSFCNVSQGLLTGIDKITNRHITAGLMEAECKNSGIYILSKEEYRNLKLSSSEKQLLKPFFKNSDIKRYYCTQTPNSYVLYLTRDLDLKNYPNLESHIRKYEKPIRARSQDRGEIQAALRLGKWWVIFAARDQKVFLGPKIISPQRSYENTFAYNEREWFASADVYYITEKNSNVKLKYVLSLLNSRLFYLWFYLRGKKKGEMLELLYTPLMEVPIKIISEEEQEPFIVTVDRILLITKDDDYLQNPQKQSQVKALEQEIDQMVYQLYGLTEEEIQIIERNE